MVCALAAGVLAAAAAGCAVDPAEPTSDHTAPTVVSLNPCLDAILVKLADREQILALSHYSLDPFSSSAGAELARALGTTGGTAEEVIALDPDVVLASVFLDPARRAAFERLGIQVETFDSPRTFAQSTQQIERVGQILSRQAAATALVRELGAAPPNPTGRKISVVVWQPGQIVPGEATLIHELLSESGFSSHTAARGMAQGTHITLEQILADPPELVLILGSSRGQSHPLLEELAETRVEHLETRLLNCGGPTIAETRARLAELRNSFG